MWVLAEQASLGSTAWSGNVPSLACTGLEPTHHGPCATPMALRGGGELLRPLLGPMNYTATIKKHQHLKALLSP